MSEENIAARLSPSTNNRQIFHCAELAIKLQPFTENQSKFDVVLIAGIEEYELQAHRFVLGESSEYFQAMFRFNPQETNTVKIKLNEVDSVTLKLILDFMYTGTIEFSWENVDSILKAACFLQINKLVVNGCDFLEERINASNCLSIASFAKTHGGFALYKKSTSFAYTYFEQVSTEEEFLQLNENQLRKIVSSDDICVSSEQVVFHSLVRWLEYDKQNRVKLICNLLSHVRFNMLTPRFLIKNVHSLYKSRECYEFTRNWLQWHLSPKKLPPLPEELTKPRTILRNKKLYYITGYCTTKFKVQIFDPKLNSWSYAPLPKPARNRVSYGVAIINDKLIIAGGKFKGKLTNTVECLDLKTNEWTFLPSMKQWRESPGMVELNGYLYVVGGFGSYYIRSVERFDFSTQMWEYVVPLISPFEWIKLAVHNGFLYAIGCVNAKNMQRYDPTTNKWVTKAFMKKKSSLFGFNAVGKYLYAVGGVRNGKQSKSVKRYHPSTDSWASVSSLKEPRGSTMCTAFDQRLIIAGGFDGLNHLDTVQEYNPETDEWTTLAPLLSKDEPMSLLTV